MLSGQRACGGLGFGKVIALQTWGPRRDWAMLAVRAFEAWNCLTLSWCKNLRGAFPASGTPRLHEH